MRRPDMFYVTGPLAETFPPVFAGGPPTM